MSPRSYYVEMPSLIRYPIFLLQLASIASTLQRQLKVGGGGKSILAGLLIVQILNVTLY